MHLIYIIKMYLCAATHINKSMIKIIYLDFLSYRYPHSLNLSIGKLSANKRVVLVAEMIETFFYDCVF